MTPAAALRGGLEENTMNTQYFVTQAPGWYGDESAVLSSHRTLEAAMRAANHPSRVVRLGGKRKGDRWYRAAENMYPVAVGQK